MANCFVRTGVSRTCRRDLSIRFIAQSCFTIAPQRVDEEMLIVPVFLSMSAVLTFLTGTSGWIRGKQISVVGILVLDTESLRFEMFDMRSFRCDCAPGVATNAALFPYQVRFDRLTDIARHIIV